jgi:hypothetical protein
MELLTQILGMTITNDQTAGIVTVNQQHAITKMLQDFGYESAEALPTPMENGWHPDVHPNDREKVAQFPIKETLGALGHIANTTRCDIAFAVGRLQREAHQPTMSVIHAINRIMRYLIGTKTLSIVYKRNYTLKFAEEFISTYTDASWGSYTESIESSCKSTTGHITLFDQTPLSWGSNLQRGTPAQSSAEAEYIATYAGITEGRALMLLAKDFNIPSNGTPLKVLVDSAPAIAISKNPINYKLLKHVALKYHWVRVTVRNGEAELIKVPTGFQFADIFTKVMKTHKAFKEIRDKLLE